MYYLGIDVGTTAIKGILVDEAGGVCAAESREHQQYFPRPGWVEQDPQELLENCLSITQELLRQAKLSASDLGAIGLDHQGETCLIWDRDTGQPIYPAIVWQDRRMAQVTQAFDTEKADKIRKITGLRLDSYYSAWKWRWILDHTEQGQCRAERGELLAGTLNTWLIWKLTGGRSFVIDHSSAGCTMLCDERSGEWDDWILSELKLPRRMLPQLISSDEVRAETEPSVFWGARVPISATLTDGSAGIVSAGATYPGGSVCTYGTGNFLHLITGGQYVPPREGLTASCCLSVGQKRLYQLNGICYTAGAAVKWLRDGLGLIQSAGETDALARSVRDTSGVYFVPALNGLATPEWDQSVRGAFMGMTGGTTRAHLVRAVLESIAMQVTDCCQILMRVSDVPLRELYAVGGMTANNFLMQLQADLLGIPVCLPTQTEPAYGTALLAADAVGSGPGIEAIRHINPLARRYEPQMQDSERVERLHIWQYAVERCKQWYPTDKIEC